MAKNSHPEISIKFRNHLKTVRLNNKLSLRKLASKCDIENADIVRYKKGEINMSFLKIVGLAKGLEIPLKELINF